MIFVWDMILATVIAGVLTDGGVGAVIEEEGHPVDPFAGSAVRLMDQDTGHGLIGNLEGFCLSVLHLKVVSSL